MVASILGESRISHIGQQELPNRDAVETLVELIREVMFPGFFGERGLSQDELSGHVAKLLDRIATNCHEQMRRVLSYEHAMATRRGYELPEPLSDEESEIRARKWTREFLATFPEVRRLLAMDVQAAYEGDPAATHIDETIFCYPGIDAIFSHRVAHELSKMRVPLLPRIIQELAHGRTGIDIHPGATIGESFFVDHGGGTVIGETTVIGNDVRIYQGVTLGNKSFEMDDEGHMVRGTKRHPTIGDRVIIYADACVLGGDTVVGDDCIISGSVYITQSVPTGHIVRQAKPELDLRTNRKIEFDEAGDTKA